MPPWSADTFAHVCDAHDWTIPREPFRSDAPEGERLRQIAQLQLRLAELEPDIEGSGWTIGDPRQGLPDALPVLIWSSGPDGRPTFVNRTWLEFTGNDEPHELGRGLQGVHPEDRAGVEAAYNRALEGRAPFRTEFRYRRRDGAWRWLLNTASPRLDAEGSFLGFSGACIDITDRKAAEEQASQARNLESLGRLAGGLAHDFNNLLTSINGYSEIGLSLVPEAGRLHDFLTEIRDAGERANELTRQLLAYGSKQVLSATVFDLNPTLDHMEPVLRRQLGDGIRLERVQQAGLGRIQADPGQTQQLILGLILNARDAMPEGGTLTLETEDVLAQGGPDGGPRPYVRLSVRDTGPGMDPETMSRVFEPFFTTKRAGAGGQGRMGAGLGLASAYGFARQSGGFLSVESEPGAGSVFRLHLPWIDPESGKTARSGPLPAGGASILIAAGSETLRRFLSHALYAEGYAVSEAPDVPTTGTGGDADPGPDLLIAEDPCGPIRAATLAARLKLRHPALRALSIAAAAEVSDLPLPPAGNALLPLTLPLTRGGLIAHARRALGDAGAEKIAPGSFPRSGPRAG
jgi:two-component system, cell cycle sensor histidine kinase and response regulator CckA